MAQTASQGKCIIVFNTKGGVGKTVICANLGVVLASQHKTSVCLVDFDVTGVGDLGRLIGLTPHTVYADLIPKLPPHVAINDFPLDSLVFSHASGVDLIQCTSKPDDTQLLSAHHIQLLLEVLKLRYRFIIVDTRFLNDALLAAFDEASMILMPVTPDVVALYQSRWAMEIFESHLFPKKLFKFVLNRADSRGGVGSHDVRTALPCPIIAELPSDGRAMGEAVNQGAPLVSLFHTSKLALAIRKLADKMVKDNTLFLTKREITQDRGQDSFIKTAPDQELPEPSFAEDAAQAEFVEQQNELTRLKMRVHHRLVEEMNLKQVDLASLNDPREMRQLKKRCEQVIARLLSEEMGEGMLPRGERAGLVKDMVDEALGFGPLEEFLADPSITDILVNNKDQVYVERNGVLELTNKRFVSDEQVRAIIERIVAPLGRRIDESTPMVDARLPDGSRVNAIIPPLSIKGPSLSIRKFATVRFAVDKLVEIGSLTYEMAEFIRSCVYARKNMIISGGTGSGKTTFLNIVSAFIPSKERIVTIEDAAELRLKQMHWVSLESRPPNVESKGEVTIRDLFRNALRMRPDRIVIGECRGDETLDMLQAMNTGHDGSLTTVHANSPRDVISRLDSMVLMSNIDLPIRAIREMVASAVDLVIHTARSSDGSRRVTHISELIGLQGEEIQFKDLFAFIQTGVDEAGKVEGYFTATGNLPSFFNEIRLQGLNVREEWFKPKQSSSVS